MSQRGKKRKSRKNARSGGPFLGGGPLVTSPSYRVSDRVVVTPAAVALPAGGGTRRGPPGLPQPHALRARTAVLPQGRGARRQAPAGVVATTPQRPPPLRLVSRVARPLPVPPMKGTLQNQAHRPLVLLVTGPRAAVDRTTRRAFVASQVPRGGKARRRKQSPVTSRVLAAWTRLWTLRPHLPPPALPVSPGNIELRLPERFVFGPVAVAAARPQHVRRAIRATFLKVFPTRWLRRLGILPEVPLAGDVCRRRRGDEGEARRGRADETQGYRGRADEADGRRGRADEGC